MTFIKEFKLRYRIAKTTIDEIRIGDWVPVWNIYSKDYLTAVNDNKPDYELWIGNGASWCELTSNNTPTLGLFWRHWVWWAAARNLKKRVYSDKLDKELGKLSEYFDN